MTQSATLQTVPGGACVEEAGEAGESSLRFLQLLQCPACRSVERWDIEASTLRCNNCGTAYRRGRNCLDLRPRGRPWSYDVKLTLEPPEHPGLYDTEPPEEGRWKDLPHRMTPGMATEIRRVKPGRVLDLGCGPAQFRDFFESLGAEYVGVDLEREEADLLADAHALPLADERFDLVISMQVLEHLWNPPLGVWHVARVLRPGGTFIGSAAFMEPQHQSMFHPTPEGIACLLRGAGLVVERLWPMPEWTVADALDFHLMSRGSAVERMGGRLLRWLGRMHWHYAARSFHLLRFGRAREAAAVSRWRLRWCGAACFCACKPCSRRSAGEIPYEPGK